MAIPSIFLLAIYIIFGAIAVLFYLLGILTIIGFEAWVFFIYFDYTDEAEKPLTVEEKYESTRRRSQNDNELNYSGNSQQQQYGSNGAGPNYPPEEFKNEQDQLKVNAFDNIQGAQNNQQQFASIKQIYEVSERSQNVSRQLDSSNLDIAASSVMQGTTALSQNQTVPHSQNSRLYKNLQSNPFINLSPDLADDFRTQQQSYNNRKSMELQQNNQMMACLCDLGKENFKIVIKAKSSRILSFLQLLEVFYQDLMKSEQFCGKNYSKLGQPTISLIGKFSEPILFKENILEDHNQMLQSKTAHKTEYSFCKWKLIRKAFNEIGVCHVENALFYREGVLANISALADQVQNSVRTYQSRHIILMEELDNAEKKLQKINKEHGKCIELVEESRSLYEKSRGKMKEYQKELQLEMKFKLYYKQMQDIEAKKSDAFDNMKETKEKYQKETQQMIIELRALDRNKVEIFKSTLMSVVDTHFDFEFQIQTFFDECLKQSNQIKIQLKSNVVNNQSVVSNNTNSNNGQSISNEEEDFLKLQKKRSLKYKVEEVQNLMDEIDVEDSDDDDGNFQPESAQESPGIRGKSSKNLLLLNKEEERKSIFDEYRDEFEDIDDTFSLIDNDQLGLPKNTTNHTQYFKKSHDFSQQQINNNTFQDNQSQFDIMSIERRQAQGPMSAIGGSVFSPNKMMSPNSSSISLNLLKALSNINPEKLDVLEFEKLVTSNQTKFDTSARQTQLMIEGIKDLIMYLRQMKEIISKYHDHHSKAIENQYEEVTHINTRQQSHVLNSNEYQAMNNVALFEQLGKIRQLKIFKENDEVIHKIWQSFINNFKSFLHQYELLIQKINQIQSTIDIYLASLQNQKDQIVHNCKQQTSIFRTSIQRLKQSIAQLKYIKQKQQQQFSSNEFSPTTGEGGQSSTIPNNTNYLQKYENMKLIIQNPTPLLKIAYSGNLPSEEQLREVVLQNYHILCEHQSSFLENIKQNQTELVQLQRTLSDKLLTVKCELIHGHKERSKNSQVFFQNVMHQIENHINSSENEYFEENEDEITANEYREAGINSIRWNGQAIGGISGGHRQGCIYYKSTSTSNNEGNLNISSNAGVSLSGGAGKKTEKNDVKISPEKRSLLSINSNTGQNSQQLPSQSRQGPLLNNQSRDDLSIFQQYDYQSNNPLRQPQIQEKSGESTGWFNKALEVFYNEWKTSGVFQKFILKEAYLIANKGRPKLLSEIEVHKVKLHGKAPEFQRIQKLDSHPNDFLYDIDLSLRGNIEILIKTVINFNWGLKIPITVNIILRSINGRVRVFYSNDKSKGCWYGFVGKPVIKFNLDPVIGNDNQFSFKNVPKIREIFEDLISKRFDKYCLPNKRPLKIPVTELTPCNWPRTHAEKSTSTIHHDLLGAGASVANSRGSSVYSQYMPSNLQNQISAYEAGVIGNDGVLNQQQQQQLPNSNLLQFRRDQSAPDLIRNTSSFKHLYEQRQKYD